VNGLCEYQNARCNDKNYMRSFKFILLMFITTFSKYFPQAGLNSTHNKHATYPQIKISLYLIRISVFRICLTLQSAHCLIPSFPGLATHCF
jgi:hypothetical protein